MAPRETLWGYIWSPDLLERLFQETKNTADAQRHDLQPNHLSTWRRLTKDGKLVIPELAEVDFAAIVVSDSEPLPTSTTAIEIVVGQVALRLDTQSDAGRIAQIVHALNNAK